VGETFSEGRESATDGEKGILMILMTSGGIQWQLRRPFHKTSSQIDLKGGLGADVGA
jgi:hypothetical protein